MNRVYINICMRGRAWVMICADMFGHHCWICCQHIGTNIQQFEKRTNKKHMKYHLVGGCNPLKNIRQNGNLPQVGVNTNIWNHHLVTRWLHLCKQKSSKLFYPRNLTWSLKNVILSSWDGNFSGPMLNFQEGSLFNLSRNFPFWNQVKVQNPAQSEICDQGISESIDHNKPKTILNDWVHTTA